MFEYHMTFGAIINMPDADKLEVLIVGYIKEGIRKGCFLKKLRIVAFTDSVYTTGDHHRSIIGGVVMLYGTPRT